MTTSNLQVRRATVEDLPKLVALWQQEDLPWQGLEKQFKQFQVVEAPGGELLGAVGLETAGTEGRVHSEVFAHAEQSDALRDLFWERLQVLARNHGLVRLWTQFASPFWNQTGFQFATADLLAKLPAAFGAGPQPWRFLQLREEAAPVSIEKEFAAFKAMEKEHTEKLFRRAKLLKLIAGIVVMAVFFLLAFWVLAWFKARGRLAQ